MELPRIGEYLQRVWELGRRSLRPAMPALVFLYFYRVGVGAYLAVSDRSFDMSSPGNVDLLPGLAIAASVLPLFLLVYTPMLPIQDDLLRARPVTLLAAIRRTLECGWNLTLSGIVQAFLLFVPFFIACLGAALAVPLGGDARAGAVRSMLGVGDSLNAARLFAVALAVIAGVLGMLVVGLFLMFATPAVVLDDVGPVRSIGTSVRLVRKHLGAVLGRIVAFGLLSFVAVIVLTMPTTILSQVAEVSGGSPLPLKIATVIWSSAVAVMFFPFGIASLTVLYRALVPATDGTPSQAPVAIEGDEYRRASPSTAPFE